MTSRLSAAALALLISASAFADAPYVVTTLPPAAPAGNSQASDYTAVGDALFFYAETAYGYPALWRWSEADGLDLVRNLVDNNSYYGSPYPVWLMAFGDKLLFGAYVDSRGIELWITDGTAAGTTLLKDIYPGGSSTPVPMFAAGGKAYFTAFDPTNGREVWVTDGTPEGTSLLIDITGDSLSSVATGFVELDGLVYFLALNQLYVSDGTPAGTSVVASGAGGTSLGVLGDRIYFLGSDLGNGRELWSTDGTPAGTAIVKDINPGAASSWGGISTPFVAHGSSLLFIAEDAASGRELWTTDGTEAGTQLVEDITPGVGSTEIERLASSPVGTFFVVGNTDLWVTDGTAAGTVLVEEYSRVIGLATAANGAYVVSSEGVAIALSFSDGTAAGTEVIPGAVPSWSHNLTSTGGMVVFTGTDATNGAEPWITDGTEAGTHLLANVSTAGGTYPPAWTHSAGNLLYFGLGNSLYRSDGTAPGTFKVGQTHNSYYYYTSQTVGAVGDTFLFDGTSEDESRGLWKSDGTVAGTSLLKEFSRIEFIFETDGGYALIVASESSYGAASLWRSDGTAAGTHLLTSSLSASHGIDVGGRVFFLSNLNSWPYQADLWETRGTAASTRMIADGKFGSLSAAGGILYLVNTTTANGAEIWRSDGTAEGTSLIKDIRPGAQSSSPELLTPVGSMLFFVADDGIHGRELWRTDGTEAGTFRLADIRSGTSPSIRSLTASGRFVYFFAEDDLHGAELWRSDGTVAGTIRLTDATPSVWGSSSSIADVDRRLMFTGVDSLGYELWESDGTAAGTYLAHDLIPGSSSVFPSAFEVAGDRFFFGTHDGRLWAMARAATRLTVGDVSVTEGNSGSSTLTFTVTRDGSLSGAATVNYATADLTASAGVDYQADSGTVSFADGEATKNISINILGDAIIEPNEAFALELSSATGATLTRALAFGMIEDNDRKVALSIVHVPRGGSRIFRISNSGPSAATVTLRVSESPYAGGFSCDGRNPSICNVGLVPAGGSVQFAVDRSSYSYGAFDSSKPPGYTLTATVSAIEAEDDTSDNTVARMITESGTISLPSYLVADSTPSAFVTSYSMPTSVGIALTGGVVVSPSSILIDQANPVGTLNLTVAPNAWGWSNVTLTGSSTVLFRIPIVLPSESVLLDTKIIVDPRWSYEIGEPIVLPVTVVGVLPDGTHPSGAVNVIENGNVVQTETLDALGEATFTLLDVSAGSHQYIFEYAGDQYFNSVRTQESVTVYGRSTWTTLSVAQQGCGESDLVVMVTNSGGHTPTGSVKIRVDNVEVAELPLVPTGTPGQARVTTTYSFPSAQYYTYVTATYVPVSPFSASSDSEYVYPMTCPAPTLIASAGSASSVSLIWSDVGADMYEIVRAAGPSPTAFTSVGTTAASTFVDSTVAPGKSYIYKVLAKTSGGVTRSTSAGDLATTIIFTDDPIVFRATPIKATHIIQARIAANAVRELAGQPPLTFGAIAGGSPVSATDITELRTAIGNALVAAGLSPVTWIDSVSAGGLVKTMHVQQLRNVVK